MERFLRLFEGIARPFDHADPGPPPKSGLGFILHYARLTRWPFAAMLVVGFLQALVEAALFIFVGVIVDLMAGSPRDMFFIDNAGLLLAMAATVLVARSLIALSTAVLEEQIVVPDFFTLVRWFSHRVVSRQDTAFFDDEMAGRVSQKVMQAGQAAGDFMISLLQIIWFIAIFAATTLIVVARLDLLLLLPVMLWLGLVGLIARNYIPQIRQRGKALAEAFSTVSGRVVDGYTNIRTVKLYGAEDAQDAHIQAAWRTSLEKLRAFTRAVSGMRILSQVLSSTMLVVVGALALWLYTTGTLSAGDVAVVMALCLRLNLLLGRLLGLLNGLFRNLGTVQNSAELIARPKSIHDPQTPVRPDFGAGDVRFDSVDFQYAGSETVFTGFDLAIAAGERVGIVGRSGAGKTTIGNLLLRLYDTDAGTISIDGIAIDQVSQYALRQQIGVVTQDPALLNRSIRDNIAYGRPDATDAEIIAAAKRARADDFIVKLKDARGRTGYDTHVGERGVKLSGGQRQRIAIARVFLKDAPILLLDEATSALDSEVEAAIQDNLAALMDGKTVIAIAHRLSTIAWLDRLIVLDDGQIVEDGTHAELLAGNGLYAQLWARQTGTF